MGEKTKFKVGDKVRIRTWEDMEKEFGLNCFRGINITPNSFTSGMRKYCGKTATIKSIDGFRINLEINGEVEVRYVFSPEMIEPANQTIVIYRKGAEVIALDKTTGNKAVAKCSPDDTFDFETGAKLAFERLYAPKVKEVKRKAKVGEYVKIVDACGGASYKNGDILKIVKISDFGEVYYRKASGAYLWTREYVVLEGYEPPTEEKKAEVVHKFKEGKIYVFHKELLGEKQIIAGRWAREYDGKIVRVDSKTEGTIDGYSFSPEWCEELPFAIGDTVKVIDSGFTYDTYGTWKGLEGYKQNFVSGKLAIAGKRYKLVNLSEHERTKLGILALIQDTDTTQVFIINIEGIEKV